MTFLVIDGSFGEGGGQTVRTAAAFSMILKRPIRVTRVRAGRRAPGLRPQHAATLRVLAEICGGAVEGGEIGSTEFTFAPGTIRDRSMKVDTGTAASVTLALQSIIPAVSLSGVSLDLELTGGTDVPWSPTCDYFSTVFSSGLRRLGLSFKLDVLRRGYYPNGGGVVRVHVDPCQQVLPVELTSRDPNPIVSIVSRAGMLPERVVEELASSAASQLERNGVRVASVSTSVEESSSPGCSVLACAVGDSCFIGADSLGVRGKPAVKVGSEVGTMFAKAYGSKACIDAHLADMISPLLFLAPARSRLLTTDISEHLKTGLHVAGQFVPAMHSTTFAGEARLLTIDPS